MGPAGADGSGWRAGEKAAAATAAALWGSGGGNGEDDLFFPRDVAPRFALCAAARLFLTGTECLWDQKVQTDAQRVCFSFFHGSDGQTDVLRMWKVSWHDGRGRNLTASP